MAELDGRAKWQDRMAKKDIKIGFVEGRQD
jgi:hypothetical protein